MQNNNASQPLPVVVSKNIYQRFIEVQKKVTSVYKGETVKMSEKDKGYKAVSHDDVAALLHTPLAEAGIVLLPTVTKHNFSDFEVEKFDKYNNRNYKQKWYRTDLEINVKWVNADDPKDFIESTGGAYALDTSDKSFAKAYSLALKIILLKVHLLESSDEEEKRSFENEEQEQSKNNTQNKTQQNSFQKKPLQNHAPGGLTQDQLKRMYAIALKASWSSDYARVKVYTMYKVTPSKLSKDQYDKICAGFEKYSFNAKAKAEMDHAIANFTPEIHEKVIGKKPAQMPSENDSPMPDYENEPQ